MPNVPVKRVLSAVVWLCVFASAPALAMGAELPGTHDDAKPVAAQPQPAAGSTRKVTFGPVFKDAAAMVAALDELQFLGHGYFFANQIGSKQHDRLELAYVELPWSSASRYLVTEKRADGSYVVTADFVASTALEVVRVRRAPQGQLQFLTRRGKEVALNMLAGEDAARAYQPPANP